MNTHAHTHVLGTLRTRLHKAGATKVLEALDKTRANDVDAIAGLFVHTTLARGFEGDVAEALARIGNDVAEGALVIGLRSKRPALRRAAARALCIAPSRSREVRDALAATNAARDHDLRTTIAIAIALASEQPALALSEALDGLTTYKARSCAVRLVAAGADAALGRALLSRVDDARWADVRVALVAALAALASASDTGSSQQGSRTR